METTKFRKANPALHFSIGQNKSLHPLFNVPIVIDTIQSFAPDLTDDPDNAKPILDQIEYYLFKQPNLKYSPLARLLSPDLYDALSGLKLLLKKHNINVTSYALEENKRQFEKWLDDELDADDVTEASSESDFPSGSE